METFESAAALIDAGWLRSGYVLWLGSAISIAEPAGMPMTRGVVRELMRHVGRLPSAITGEVATLVASSASELEPGGRLDLLQGREHMLSLPFETIMGIAAGPCTAMISDYVVGLYATPRGRHNLNHLAVKRLLLRGDAHCAITTNFDRCIEDAGVPRSRVLVPDHEAFDARPGMLVKVHGSIDQPASLAATAQALARRRNAPGWQASILGLIAGRDLVVVGYSMRDWFDIDPVLREAVRQGTRICFADPHSPVDGTPPVAAWVTHDLSDRRNNLLTALERASGIRATGRTPIRASRPRPGEPERIAAALEQAWRRHPPSPVDQVRIVIGWLDFIEQGGRALSLTLASRARFGDSVDDREIGRAYLRSRRYRRALTWLEQAAQATDTDEDRIALLCAAGHVAQAGGRPKAAARLFDRAHDTWTAAGAPSLSLRPDVADQLHRGFAENLIHRSLLELRPRRRARLRARAAWHYRRLNEYAEVQGMPIEMAELVPLLAARLALARGRHGPARATLEGLHEAARHWGDPHLRLYILRLLAFATPARRWRLLRVVWIEAAHEGRLQELLKITAAMLGLDGYGRTGPLEMRVRNGAVATYDVVKELILTMAGR